jgi:hypothetical protein
MKKLLPALVFLAISLSACDGSGTSQQSSDDGSGQISDSDQLKLRKFGACASITEALVRYLNNQSDADQSGTKEMVDVWAYQATIYTILELETAHKYGPEKLDEAVNISHEYWILNGLNKSLNGADLDRMHSQKCPISKFPNDEAQRIMEDDKDEYGRILEYMRNIR